MSMMSAALTSLTTGLFITLIPITVMAETVTQTIIDSDGAVQINDAKDTTIQVGDTHIYNGAVMNHPSSTSSDAGIQSTIHLPIRNRYLLHEEESHNPLVRQFQGEWYTDNYGGYSFLISGNNGIATLSNAPEAYRTGDTILRIDSFQENTFQGRQIFTDGSWESVTGILSSDNSLVMEGGGFTWIMNKR